MEPGKVVRFVTVVVDFGYVNLAQHVYAAMEVARGVTVYRVAARVMEQDGKTSAVPCKP